MIIEDEDNIRETLEDVLSMQDYIVYSAANGVEGVSKAIELLPDLIICDIVMPELNGFEVIKQLKQNPLTFTIPFLFLTAKSERHERRYGMELGADDYITKPFQGDEIIRAVETRIAKQSDLMEYHKKNLEELQKNIASALPHEMRTPLTVMIGFAQIIQNSINKLSNEEIENMAKNIAEAGERLLRLISNYTQFVELLNLEYSHKPKPNKITNVPERIITDIANTIAMRYDRINDLMLSLTNVPIHIPEGYFSKAVEEVIDNAFKFSPNGSEVKITAFKVHNYFCISVADRGRGFEPEQIQKIGAFMQFKRQDYEQQGAGLGLAIAQKTADLFNGEINIESTPNQYTIVELKFPIAQNKK